jgi:hypothetical protein
MDLLDEEEILQAGGIIRKIEKISFLLRRENKIKKKRRKMINNRVMITGGIPRVTDFEKGFHYNIKKKKMNLIWYLIRWSRMIRH